MVSADPTKAADELDKWATGLERKARAYTELQQRMGATSATESTSDGAIRVTVDSNGVPTDIAFSERARDLEPSRLSSEVMACMRRAQARMRAQVEDLVLATVPVDDEPARNIIAQYQQRFPDQDDETVGGVDDHGDRLGAIEDEPAASPPRASRPTPAEERDDWDDGSPLR